jgi:hypothetical protein
MAAPRRLDISLTNAKALEMGFQLDTIKVSLERLKAVTDEKNKRIIEKQGFLLTINDSLLWSNYDRRMRICLMISVINLGDLRR